MLRSDFDAKLGTWFLPFLRVLVSSMLVTVFFGLVPGWLCKAAPCQQYTNIRGIFGRTRKFGKGTPLRDLPKMLRIP